MLRVFSCRVCSRRAVTTTKNCVVTTNRPAERGPVNSKSDKTQQLLNRRTAAAFISNDVARRRGLIARVRKRNTQMKIQLSAAALGAALMISGAGVSMASAAPVNKALVAQENAAGAATDVSAQRRRYGYGPRYGYRPYYAPRYYPRPYGYGYRPYGYYGGGPYSYGPSIGLGFGFGGPRFGFY